MKSDTSPSMAKKFREMLMERSGEERMMMGCSMSRACRILVIQAIERKHPGISPLELRKKLFMRYYGKEFTQEQAKRFFSHLDRVIPKT
ncbi:MAG: hypothetical protein KDK71_06560 [Chlamydiia bacterium]|nr:hypothetical protein [Chlamydiia bacterium]